MKTKFACCLDYLCKEAEDLPEPAPPVVEVPPKKNPFWEGAKVVGSGLAGLAAGQLAGAAAGKGIEYLTHQQGGDPVELARKIGPVVGTAAGLLYPMWRAREQQEVTNAVESARDHNERRLSGQ